MKVDDKSGERIGYVDIARGFGILMMVWTHAALPGTKIMDCFMIVLFIFISGFVFNENKPFVSLFKNKLMHIYLPFVKYELLFLFFHNILYRLHVNEELYTVKDYFRNIIRILLFDNTEIMLSQFWYLFASAIIVILFKIIYLVFKNDKMILLFSLAMFIVSYFTIHADVHVYWCNCPIVDCVLSMTIFFTLGWYIKKHPIIFMYLGNFGITFIFGILFLGIIFIFNLNVNVRSDIYSNLFLYFIVACCGIYIVFSVSLYVEKKLKILSSVMNFIGHNTMSILALHYLVFKAVEAVLCMIHNISFEEMRGWGVYANGNVEKLPYFFAGIILPLVGVYVGGLIKAGKRTVGGK